VGAACAPNSARQQIYCTSRYAVDAAGCHTHCTHAHTHTLIRTPAQRPGDPFLSLCTLAHHVMSAAKEATAPAGATDAVLKPSDPVPAGSREVQGIDFNHYANRSITVEELMGGYANMGFQATSVGEAVRIINDMVSVPVLCAEC
jgi:hypothetical protein